MNNIFTAQISIYASAVLCTIFAITAAAITKKRMKKRYSEEELQYQRAAEARAKLGEIFLDMLNEELLSDSQLMAILRKGRCLLAKRVMLKKHDEYTEEVTAYRLDPVCPKRGVHDIFSEDRRLCLSIEEAIRVGDEEIEAFELKQKSSAIR